MARRVKVQAEQGDKEGKAPQRMVEEVSPEKLRAAVEKLKADGVDEKVARKVRLCTPPLAQSLCLHSAYTLPTGMH